LEATAAKLKTVVRQKEEDDEMSDYALFEEELFVVGISESVFLEALILGQDKVRAMILMSRADAKLRTLCNVR
jgi:hypothetical protein